MRSTGLFTALALGAALAVGGCANDDKPATATNGSETAQAVAAAIRSERITQARLPGGKAPTTMPELDKATLPAGSDGLTMSYEDALREDAAAAGQDFGAPANEEVLQALRFGLYDALLQAGLLDPSDPGGLPAEAVITTDGARMIDPQLYDADPETGDAATQTAFNSWLASAAPSGLATAATAAFSDAAST